MRFRQSLIATSWFGRENLLSLRLCVEGSKVSSDVAFTIALLVFLIVLAAVVFRLLWRRRVTTDSHLRTHDPQLRSGPDISPISGSPEWERDNPN